MSNAATIHAYLAKEIEPAGKEALKEYADLGAKLPPAIVKLSAAIAQSDKRSIELYLNTVTVNVRRCARLAEKIKPLLDKLDKLQQREEFVDDLAEVEKWVHALDGMKKDLDKKFTSGKEVENTANKALEKLSTQNDQAADGWEAFEAWGNKQIEEARKNYKIVALDRHKVRKALDDWDAKALKEAVDSSTEKRAWVANITKEMRKRIDDLLAEAKNKKLSQALQDQLARDTKKIDSEFGALDTGIVYIYVQYKNLELKPVDSKKAASALKLPDNLEPKLKSALALHGPAVNKALDALGKQLKPPINAKTMVSKLREAGLIPDPAKIEERFFGPSPL